MIAKPILIDLLVRQPQVSDLAIIKKQADHQMKISPVCGEIIEILTNHDSQNIEIAIVLDIRPTTGHYHLGFQEIYFVLDGTITLEYYEPETDKISKVTLNRNELAVFKPRIHHRVTMASEKNRLCVICLPGFDPHDEHVSDKFY